MNLFRSAAIAMIVIASVATVSPVLACSPMHIDTPLQLVEMAEGIYRVSPVAYAAPQPSSRISPWPDTQVRFEVLAVLKGVQRASLQLPGELGREDDPNDHPVPYEFVRPGGRSGNCYAVTFRKGREYLLFVKNDTAYWSPLAPTTEQVSGPDDPWVIWVKEQLVVPAKRPN